ncbi:universal stress protein [Cognatishimia activa]|uniref:Universal stress protein F n=1 Tax=Cognatishimia activa TaxID=1715691 RepID=A0A0N7MB92_9RHOB|nr:universal stress protein [Cognatishimia activa]CUI37139.1 Universal stress protein F [Cognatishimia activa]CUK24760.1 Universal stress protein F [Cognatishimia activa]
MFNTILVPVALDHTETIARKLEVARQLRGPEGRIIAVSVFEGIPTYVAEYAMVKPDRTKMLQEIRRAFDVALTGQEDVERVTLAGKPGVVIATYADEIGADLIVTGASRPGSEGYALGSTASRLARRAPCSVLVVR